MFRNRPKIYRILCSVVLISIPIPAASQVPRGGCGNPDPDISIAGCTTKIKIDTADLQSGNVQAAGRLATAYDNRGVAYASKGLYDEAIDDYNQAIALLPKTFPVAYFNRGSAWYNQGLYDQAIAEHSQAIALNAKDIALHPAFASRYADAYSHRADAYAHKGVTDAAIADYRAALKLDPGMQSAKGALTRLGAVP